MRKLRIGKAMSLMMAFIMTFGMVSGSLLSFADSVYAAETASKDDKSNQMIFNASELPEGDITTDLVFGDFMLGATSDKKLTVDANAKTNEDGSIAFTKRLKFNGKSGETERTISFTVGGGGTASVYMISSNKEEADRALVLYDDATGEAVEGGSFYAPVAAGDNGQITPVVYNIPAEGTYRFKATQGINVYYIEVNYEGNAVSGIDRVDWDKVDAPKINSVTVDDKGAINVDVTVEMGVAGADSSRILLYQNGYENMSVQVTESGVYSLTPSLKGDFDVKVVAGRKGYADKESSVEKIRGYKIPLAVPEITWANNLGDGDVYVDWNNIGADGYTVSYAQSGTDDFTVASSNITEGSYTITGLTSGKPYEIKVEAVKGSEHTEDTTLVTVGEPSTQWYVAAVGSATSGKITVDGKDYDVTTSSGITPVDDVTGTSKTIEIAPQTNGKIADSEDGFFYYFTKINPNTENFVLTATYTVTDVDAGPDNQTGYGLYATDIVGVGSKDAKYFNSVSVGQFKMYGNGYHGHGARLITGYTSYNAFNNEDSERNHDNSNSFSVVNEDDAVKVGDTYTYTLEKTDNGYVASMNGEAIEFDGSGSLMVQEDGSINVGVASTRKVGVEISDITFTKSEGIAGGESVILVEPDFAVYSGLTSGVTDYQFIGSANVDGSLVVKDASGAEIYNGNILKDKIVRVDTKLKMGTDNTFTYEYVPDKNIENLSSTDGKNGTITVSAKEIGTADSFVYVSADGSGVAAGTSTEPLDLQTALDYARPGQTIVLLNGKYKLKSDLLIGRSVNGTQEKPITLIAETTGGVILDGSGIKDSVSMLSIVGSYWHVYGIEFAYGTAKGISVCGNNNIVEMCDLHNMKSAGLQISRYSKEPNDDRMWPSDNLIKNCDAHDCCDDGRTDADGFAAKLTCGEGNRFYGCISHHNIDDGWDLYAKSTTGEIGAVIIENCVSYSNGFLREDNLDDEKMLFGEGNGFKLGGENMFGAHQLINSVSFNNYGKGITSNSNPNCEVISCTAFNNSLNGKSYNVSLYTKTANPKAWILTGTLSVVTNITTNPELCAGSGVIYSLQSESNYIYDGVDSMNSEGVAVTTDWFENTDISVEPTRNADGTIDMHGLLVLNASAPSNTGARIDTGKNAVSQAPVNVPNVSNQSSVNSNTNASVASPFMIVIFIIVIVLVLLVVIFKMLMGR